MGLFSIAQQNLEPWQQPFSWRSELFMADTILNFKINQLNLNVVHFF